MIVKIIGLVAAALTTFAFFPQAYRVIKTKDAHSISLVMYLILSLGIVMWFVYGILVRDLPVTLANGITLIPALTVLVIKIGELKKNK